MWDSCGRVRSSHETEQSQCEEIESVGSRPQAQSNHINIKMERGDRRRWLLVCFHLIWDLWSSWPHWDTGAYLDHRLILLRQKENQCPNKDVSERESVWGWVCVYMRACECEREREKEKYRCVCVIPSSNSCCFAWTQHMNLVWKHNGSMLMCTTAATLSPSSPKVLWVSVFFPTCLYLFILFRVFFGVALLLLLFPPEPFGVPDLTGLSCRWA